MSLVGDQERDRTAASLQRHYLHGRLSADELSDRIHVALTARSTSDLRAALRGLPAWRTLREALAPASALASSVAIALVLASIWSFLSLVLLVAFVVVAIVNGPSGTEALVFAVAWLTLTYGLWRAWRLGVRRTR